MCVLEIDIEIERVVYDNVLEKERDRKTFLTTCVAQLAKVSPNSTFVSLPYLCIILLYLILIVQCIIFIIL